MANVQMSVHILLVSELHFYQERPRCCLCKWYDLFQRGLDVQGSSALNQAWKLHVLASLTSGTAVGLWEAERALS